MDVGKLGQRIGCLRKAQGLTQERLGQLLGLTAQAVSKWETGQSLPDTAVLPQLAKALKVSADRLLTGMEHGAAPSPYDDSYAKAEYYWGLEPSALAERVVGLAQEAANRGGRLVDIGSGEGRDAVYFAKCGFAVDAIELSRPGAEKIQALSRAKNCRVNVVQADFIGYDLAEGYDVIYSMGALQFLPLAVRQQHFERYRRCTRPGGINAHLIFVAKPFIPVAPDWEKNEYFYISGDLARYYHDWDIIECGERIIDCHSANVPHRHAINYIIARRVD